MQVLEELLSCTIRLQSFLMFVGAMRFSWPLCNDGYQCWNLILLQCPNIVNTMAGAFPQRRCIF